MMGEAPGAEDAAITWLVNAGGDAIEERLAHPGAAGVEEAVVDQHQCHAARLV